MADGSCISYTRNRICKMSLTYLSLDEALPLPVARVCYTLEEGQHVAIADLLSSSVCTLELCNTA